LSLETDSGVKFLSDSFVINFMPKIKNWSKQYENRGSAQGIEASWKNDITGDTIFIQTSPSWTDKPRKGNYRVQGKVDRGDLPRLQTTLKRSLSNFEESKDYAVNWMREHPKGFSDSMR